MKKLIFALLAAALVLSGCVKEEKTAESVTKSEATAPVSETEPEETAAESAESFAYSGSPLVFEPDSIPDGAEYLTVLRHKENKFRYEIRSDEMPDEMEPFCFYIPRGSKPEIEAGSYYGDALVINDMGMRLAFADGRDAVDLPFTHDDKGSLFFVHDEISGELTAVVQEGVLDEDGVCKSYYYSIAKGRITCETEERDSIEKTSYNGLILAYRSVHDESDPSREATLVIDGETGETLHVFIGHAVVECSEDAMYYLVRTGEYGYEKYDKVYNSGFEKIAESEGRFSSFTITPEGYAVLCEEENPQTYTVIDNEGNVVYTSPEYSGVICTLGGWVYVREEKCINLRKWDGGFVYTLAELNESDSADLAGGRGAEFDIVTYTTGVYRHEPTGWYRNAGTAENPEYVPEDKCGIQSGIYITLYNTNASSGIPGMSADYVYDLDSGESGVFPMDWFAMAVTGGYEKPVAE